MDAAREKLQMLGIHITDRRYTNEEVWDFADEVRKQKKNQKICTFNDLAAGLGLAPHLLSTRLQKMKTSVNPLSGEMRKLRLKEFFNLEPPAQTATPSTSMSETFKKTVEETERATKQAILEQTQAELQHQKESTAVLTETIKVKGKEHTSLSRKLQRIVKRTEKDEEKAEMAIEQLKERLHEEKEEKKVLEKQLLSSIKSTQAEKSEKVDLQKDKDYLIGQLVNLQDAIQESSAETIDMLKQRVKDLIQDVHYLESTLQDDEIAKDNTNIVRTLKEDGSYNTETVHCVMKILDNRVAHHHVGGVMAAAAELCGKSLQTEISTSTVRRIDERRLAIARQQLAYTLPAQQNTTLMSDETRKKGDSFEVFAVRDEEKDYVLGLRDIVNKSSETCLDTFKTVLSDIEQSSSTDAGNVILANIKNTMSDRAATEKKFHSLLEDYRQEVLPQVTQNWDQLSEPEQDAHARMNNFYCGLHLLVNFAEVSGKVLKLYEETQQDVEEEQEGSSRKKEECKTVRFVRQASKCLARGADEKNGCFQEFRTFLLAGADDEEERKGKLKLSKLLVPFRGNRFNILFLNAESIFFLHNDIQEFFQHVHTPSNGLHKDVADNITSKLLLSTLKALGICAKIVTGPFWRALESKGTTLRDANALYLNLYSFLCEAKTDATDVMNGELAPFPDLLEKDDVYNRLTAADPQDAATCTVLQLIFSAWLSLLEKSAADHLPGGRYWEVDDTLAAETASVPRHNKLPERIFGLLDALTKFRPVASTLCNESYIMFSLNKTSEWMQSLPPEKLEEYMDASRKEGRELRKQYQKRIRGIEEARRASLLQKRREKEERERKKTGEKLSITNDMLYYGLWQDPKAVDNLLSTMPTVAEKKKALKTQLSFRKVILGQVAEKTLFQYSEKGKEYTIAQLTNNVKTLIMMSLSEHQLPAPFVGRKFTHFQISDGKRTPYKGTVISSVPGYPAWYNVVYTTDPSDVYVYKLQEDIESGDLIFDKSDSSAEDSGDSDELAEDSTGQPPQKRFRRAEESSKDSDQQPGPSGQPPQMNLRHAEVSSDEDSD